MALEQHLKLGPVLINRSLKPVGHSTHAHGHSIEMPPEIPTEFLVAWVLGKLTPEMDAPTARAAPIPGANRLAGDVNIALQQQLLDIPVTQGRAVVSS